MTLAEKYKQDYNLVLTSYGDVRPDLIFHAECADRALDHIAFNSQEYEPLEPEEVVEHFKGLQDLHVRGSAIYENSHHLLSEVNDTLMMIRISEKRIAVEGAGAELYQAWHEIKNLLNDVPFDILKKSKTSIPIYFWGEGSGMSRSIPIVAWDDEMALNYSKDILPKVEDAVMNNLPPGLIIWHGPPGTGKTSALRALISQREERSVHYITDPEVFVNRADYMYSILEHASRMEDGKETLVICEDSGPLVTDQTGAGLGRILNLADGILGQGFNLRLLFTTNDPVGNFHPAVLRPGRCAQVLEFGQLSKEEANEWCEFHERPLVNEPKTLAWLYANAEEHKPVSVGQYL